MLHESQRVRKSESHKPNYKVVARNQKAILHIQERHLQPRIHAKNVISAIFHSCAYVQSFETTSNIKNSVYNRQKMKIKPCKHSFG